MYGEPGNAGIVTTLEAVEKTGTVMTAGTEETGMAAAFGAAAEIAAAAENDCNDCR